MRDLAIADGDIVARLTVTPLPLLPTTCELALQSVLIELLPLSRPLDSRWVTVSGTWFSIALAMFTSLLALRTTLPPAAIHRQA
jgi:hypothetical protein